MKKCLLIIALFILASGVKAQAPDSNAVKTDTTKWIRADVMPQFPGGITALIKFVKKNIQKGNYATGKVYIKFIIEKDGSLSDLAVMKSLGEAEDAEALRIMKKSPKWIPGMAQGKPIRMKFYIPIYFGDEDE
jgi:TonB family protein